MTLPKPSSHSGPTLPPDLRLAAISRRVSVSGPLAIILADLAFGPCQRDHAEVLHHTTRARVADAMGAR